MTKNPYRLSAILAAFLSVSAWSQTQLATVSGTITDPSGAVVSGVVVTIVSQGTGLKRSAPTGTAGEYRFAGLPTGTYSLLMENPGFQSQVRDRLELTSAAEVVINSQLAIGDLSQQTTVNASTAAIDSTTSTVEGLVPEQSLAELPLMTAISLALSRWSLESLPIPAVLLHCFRAVSLGKWPLMGYVRV